MAKITELVIDVSGILDEETLHEYLSTKLNFFGGYGYNFDAFWDCITDDELSAMPERLKVEGLADLKEKLPEGYPKLVTSLEDYRREFPEREVILIDGSPSGLGVDVPRLDDEES